LPIGPDIGAAAAARRAGEATLEIGEPDIVRPFVGADRRDVAALLVGAVDQDAAHAGGAHLGEGNFLAGEFGHVVLPMKRAASSMPHGPPGSKFIGNETKRSPAPVLQAIRGSPAMWSPKNLFYRRNKKTVFNRTQNCSS
jgi:hypothetical protein